jgi:hypothetical protein
VTTYWVMTGFSAFIAGMGLLAWWRPYDLDKLDDRKLRDYRLVLERRRGPWAFADLMLFSFAVVWLIAAVTLIVEGLGRGFAYLVPFSLLSLSVWLNRRNRLAALTRLGERGRVATTEAEKRAVIWYRLWGAAVFVGYVGNSLIEFYSGDDFTTADLDITSGSHAVLAAVMIVGTLGLLITYLNVRSNDPVKPGTEPD